MLIGMKVTMLVHVFLLLVFPMFSMYDVSPSVFPFKQRIEVLSSGETIASSDLSFTIDTYQLISDGKLRNCSYLRFEKGKYLLNFYTVGGCNTKKTIIWISLGEIQGRVNVTMYYGQHNHSKLPKEGSEVLFDGKFYGLTDTTCDGSWKTSPYDKDRYLAIQSTSGKVDASNSMDDHTHTWSGSSASTSYGTIWTGSHLNCSDEIDASHRDHYHSFSTTLSPSQTTLPPSYKLVLCESSNFNARKGMIFAANVTSSRPSYSLFSATSEKYILLSNFSGGGVGSHSHNHSGSLISQFEGQDAVVVGGNTPSNVQGRGHRHNMHILLDDISNMMRGVKMQLVKIISTDSDFNDISEPLLFFVSKVPPKGFLRISSFDNRYLYSDFGHGSFGQAIESSSTNHNIRSINIDKPDETVDMKSCSNAQNKNVPVSSHFHTIGTNSLSDGGWNPDDRDRHDVIVVKSKKNPDVKITYGKEVKRWKCWKIEAGSDFVCNGHGNCIAENKCECHDGWTDTECQKKVVEHASANSLMILSVMVFLHFFLM